MSSARCDHVLACIAFKLISESCFFPQNDLLPIDSNISELTVITFQHLISQQSFFSYNPGHGTSVYFDQKPSLLPNTKVNDTFHITSDDLY